MPKGFKIFLLGLLLIPCWVIGYHGVGDIGMYYAVAQYAKNLEFDRIYGINSGVGHFFYGPVSLPFFGWMPWFSYAAVRAIWIVLNTAAYLVFWWALHQIYPFLRTRDTSWLWVLVWIVSIKAIHASFQSHNVQLIIAAAVLCGEVYRRHPSEWVRFLSGWGTFFSGAVKVFPFFVSAFTYLRSDRSVRFGILSAAAVWGLLPFVYFGFDGALRLYAVFVGNLGNFHDYAPLTKDAVTLSLASLVATWFSPWIGMEWCAFITKGLSVLIGGAFLLTVWVKRNSNDDRFQTHLFALGVALMALINSTTRPDYFIFFVPAFASLAEICQKSRPSVWFSVGIFVSVFLIDLISEWTLGSRELGHQLELYRLPVVGMIVLCITLWCGLLRKNYPLHFVR